MRVLLQESTLRPSTHNRPQRTGSLPAISPQGWEILVSDSLRRTRGQQVEARDGDRRGLQLNSVQRRQGEDDPIQVRPDLLLAFVKHLCRITVSGDAIYLAALEAMGDVNATEDELRALLTAAMSEKEEHGRWPKGF